MRSENSGVGDGGNSTASAILREGAFIIGMVEDAGVVSGAVGLVTNRVTAAVEGISGWRSRRDVLSHIEYSHDR